MNTQKTTLGLLAGIATGALLGILFAPDSGKNTRKKIADKSDDYASEVKEKFNDLLDSMKDKYESLKVEATTLGKNGKKKLEEGKDELENAIN